MQGDRLIFELILNIALLVLIANLISKFRLIQKLILQEDRSRFCQWFLAGWWFCQRIQELILDHTV